MQKTLMEENYGTLVEMHQTIFSEIEESHTSLQAIIVAYEASRKAVLNLLKLRFGASSSVALLNMLTLPQLEDVNEKDNNPSSSWLSPVAVMSNSLLPQVLSYVPEKDPLYFTKEILKTTERTHLGENAKISQLIKIKNDAFANLLTSTSSCVLTSVSNQQELEISESIFLIPYPILLKITSTPLSIEFLYENHPKNSPTSLPDTYYFCLMSSLNKEPDGQPQEGRIYIENLQGKLFYRTSFSESTGQEITHQDFLDIAIKVDRVDALFDGIQHFSEWLSFIEPYKSDFLNVLSKRGHANKFLAIDQKGRQKCYAQRLGHINFLLSLQDFIENQLKLYLFLIDDLDKYVKFYEREERKKINSNLFHAYVSSIEEVLEMHEKKSLSIQHQADHVDQLFRRFYPDFNEDMMVEIIPYEKISQRSLVLTQDMNESLFMFHGLSRRKTESAPQNFAQQNTLKCPASFYHPTENTTFLTAISQALTLWDWEGADDVQLKAAKHASIEAFSKGASFLKFTAKINESALSLEKIKGDGNCFFRSVLDQLTNRYPAILKEISTITGHTVDHRTLRKLAIGALITLRDCNDDPMALEKDMNTYIAQQGRDTEWVEGEIIRATANMLGITLVLINSDGNEPTVISEGDHGVLYLAYHVGFHFDSLRGDPVQALRQQVLKQQKHSVPSAKITLEDSYQASERPTAKSHNASV